MAGAVRGSVGEEASRDLLRKESVECLRRLPGQSTNEGVDAASMSIVDMQWSIERLEFRNNS